jgi:hypothetical protein
MVASPCGHRLATTGQVTHVHVSVPFVACLLDGVKYMEPRDQRYLTQLHAELAGKLSANQRMTKRLRLAIFQVEAVMKMLSPDFNIRLIAPKRRNVGNPWFKRGALYRAVIDTLRRSAVPMTTREITDALLAGKKPEATRHQAMVLQAAILAALRARNGTVVDGDGPRGKWRLKESAN